MKIATAAILASASASLTSASSSMRGYEVVDGGIALSTDASDPEGQDGEKQTGEESSILDMARAFKVDSTRSDFLRAGKRISDFSEADYTATPRSDHNTDEETYESSEEGSKAAAFNMGVSATVDLVDDPSSSVARCEVTSDQPCDYAYLRENLPQGKTQWFVVPGGDTICIDEDSPYGFGVFLPPDNEPDPSKLMIWFNGGGACFDYETCVTMDTANTQVIPETQGYFNYALENNPLREGGWAAVTVGYCSGDMHVGDAMVELVDQNDAAVSRTVRFNGYNNTLSVMYWIKRQPEFDAAAAAGGGLEVAGAGCSAGSLGVQLWADYLVREMGVSKLQPDSYIGMFPEGGNAALNIWNACKVAGDIGIMSEELVRKCTCPSGLNCLHDIQPVVLEYLAKNPTLPTAYTGSANDNTQLQFYALVASSFDGIGSVEAFMYAMTHFPSYLNVTLASYGNVSGAYSNYIVDTDQHCFVNKDATFAEEGAPGTTSIHAKCAAADPNTGKCIERESMGAFARAFLNGAAGDQAMG